MTDLLRLSLSAVSLGLLALAVVVFIGLAVIVQVLGRAQRKVDDETR
jgi:hypothetical protein